MLEITNAIVMHIEKISMPSLVYITSMTQISGKPSLMSCSLLLPLCVALYSKSFAPFSKEFMATMAAYVKNIRMTAMIASEMTRIVPDILSTFTSP